jgi:hypothetical protein
MDSDDAVHKHPQREVEFHLTLTEEDRELLDTLAHRMDVSRTETISRALHLLESIQQAHLRGYAHESRAGE